MPDAEPKLSRPHPKKGDWLAIEDFLPDKSGSYLAYGGRDHLGLPVYFIVGYDAEYQEWEPDYDLVTHWMPIPPGPTEAPNA